jgi:hypothetical protein
VHLLSAPLERGTLQRKQAAGRSAHQESEVDMDEMAMNVKQNVAVMPILHLQETEK